MHLTEAEWKVMNCLWRAGPASARDVLDRLGPKAGWAYTTVKTMLTRLAEKGAVKERALPAAAANATVYEPLVTQRAARRFAFRALVDRAFGGAFGDFVHHLVAAEKLSVKDKAKLKQLLAELDLREGRS